MIGQQIVYHTLESLDIKFDYYESPKDFVNEEDIAFWQRINCTRCKNLFMRNHKGDRHFLIISDYYKEIEIRILEQKIKKGKISFASQQRMDKYLKGKVGAISVFSLLNDLNHQVEVFIDESLRSKEKLTFLPNELNALVAISFDDFIRILNYSGNTYEFINLSHS